MVVVVAALVLRTAQNWVGFSTGALVAGLVIDFLFLASWWLIPSAGRTKEVAGLYAHQLLQAVVAQSR